MGKEERLRAVNRLQEILECKKRHLEEFRKLAALFTQDIQALDPGDLVIVRDILKDGPMWEDLGCSSIPDEDYRQQIDEWLSSDTHYEYLELKKYDNKLGMVLSLPDGRQWASAFVGFSKGNRAEAEASLMQKAADRLELYFKASARAEGWFNMKSHTINMTCSPDGTVAGSIIGPKDLRIGAEYRADDGMDYQAKREKLEQMLKINLTYWYEGRL